MVLDTDHAHDAQADPLVSDTQETSNSQTRGFLSAMMSESFSVVAIILSVVNMVLIVVLVLTCWRRKRRQGTLGGATFASNIIQSHKLGLGYDSIRSRLSASGSVSRIDTDTESLGDVSIVGSVRL